MSKALVICPASLKLNWAAEVRRWRPDLTPVVLSGRGSFRWPDEGEIVIVNYDLLPEGDSYSPPGKSYKLPVPTPGCPEGVTLVLDEAHYCKSAKAARTAAVKSLAAAVKGAGGRVWLATGTPLVNRPQELWTVLQIAGLAREAFGTWDQFVQAFGGRMGRFGYEWPTVPPTDVAARLRRVMLARTREAVLPQLPTKRRQNIPVNGLDAATLRACDTALAALEAAGFTAEAVAQGVAAAQRTRIPFEALANARALLAAAKVPALLELVEGYEEANEPVLVFSAHLAPLDAVGSRPGWAKITGETPMAERQAIVERFQAGQLKGVAISIRAGGTGITLTRAAHEIFVDLDWTPAANEQAEDRAVRIGQTRGVLVQRLVATHALDERVLAILEQKAELIAHTVGAAAD